MGRKRGGEERRSQIVEALMRVMAARGYERASIAEIAREAGLASGLIHYYFKTKQDILLALMDQLSAHLRTRYEARLESAESAPWSRLDAFIEAYVGLEGEPPTASDSSGPSAQLRCWVVIGAEALHLPDIRDVYESILRDSLEQLKLHLVELLATEGRQIDAVHQMAAGIMSAIEGAYKLGVTSSGLVPSGFAAPMIKQMARGLVAAQPPRQGEEVP